MEITVILKIIGALFCCFMVFAAGCIAWWLFLEWGKRELARENEYDEKYKWLQNLINILPADMVNYDYIRGQIEKLEGMTYKNPEKTKVLKDNFYWKFRSENTRRVNEFRKVILKENGGNFKGNGQTRS